MKHLLLSILVLSSLTTLAAAQAVDPTLQAAVDAAIPAQYAGYTSLALIALMMLGRWIKAVQNSTGIRGWLSAIWMGTNVPHILIGTLALLILPACTTDAQSRLEAAAISATASAAQGYATSGKAGALNGAATGLANALQPPAKQPVNVQP